MEIVGNYSYKATPLRHSISSLVMNGYAVVKIPAIAQAAVWSVLDGIDSVPLKVRERFSFPEITDGFLRVGGEHAKYTSNIDLCDRFCYWHKHRENHRATDFSADPIYAAIAACEFEMHDLAQEMISGLWEFFNSSEQLSIRESSYLQVCIYANEHREASRRYLQDRHEDGHLITLIKPTRDGLVMFPGGPDDSEFPVFLHDDELLVITGSLLTALSDGRIPPMYHAVKNPHFQKERKSMVYFAIPDLSRTYTTLLAGSQLNVAELADESHRAFGNTALI